MKLEVPKEKAIELLEKRKIEIDSYDFDYKVWQNKTQDNLVAIFGILDTKSIEIRGIEFYSIFPEFRDEILEKGKIKAKKYIESFIEQIEEFTEIQNNISLEKEKHFEKENQNLKSQLTNIITKSNSILEDRNELLTDINSKNKEIKFLKENTVQLSEITLNKLFSLIKNLPLTQTIGLITAILSIIGFSYWLGMTIKENSFLKKEFQLESKINKLNSTNEKLNSTIDKLKSESEILKENVKKLKSEKLNTKKPE